MAFRIEILGAVGVPANYGGFETVAENLARYHSARSLPCALTVYCSGKSYPEKRRTYLSARLKYVPLKANGMQSIPYDIWSLLSAVWNCSNVILLLGVSGAIALPLVRLISRSRIITNIDGIEWRRAKWTGLTRYFLKFSERIAVRFSHELIADNAAIGEYLRAAYGASCHVIPYGGDHAVTVDAVPVDEYSLPEEYAFSVCRIEPENNIHLILEAFSRFDKTYLVLVGNWNYSEYGRMLRNRYASFRNIRLLDPIYDLGKLKSLRSRAAIYLHGHSAGGTNPSLVEAMHFGKPVVAFDCDYNRYTTEDSALFFKDSDTLFSLITSLDSKQGERIGKKMLEIARRRYVWSIVARQYFELMLGTGDP